jgi:hypothetical protein
MNHCTPLPFCHRIQPVVRNDEPPLAIGETEVRCKVQCIQCPKRIFSTMRFQKRLRFTHNRSIQRFNPKRRHRLFESRERSPQLGFIECTFSVFAMHCTDELHNGKPGTPGCMFWRLNELDYLVRSRLVVKVLYERRCIEKHIQGARTHIRSSRPFSMVFDSGSDKDDSASRTFSTAS